MCSPFCFAMWNSLLVQARFAVSMLFYSALLNSRCHCFSLLPCAGVSLLFSHLLPPPVFFPGSSPLSPHLFGCPPPSYPLHLCLPNFDHFHSYCGFLYCALGTGPDFSAVGCVPVDPFFSWRRGSCAIFPPHYTFPAFFTLLALVLLPPGRFPRARYVVHLFVFVMLVPKVWNSALFGVFITNTACSLDC